MTYLFRTLQESTFDDAFAGGPDEGLQQLNSERPNFTLPRPPGGFLPTRLAIENRV